MKKYLLPVCLLLAVAACTKDKDKKTDAIAFNGITVIGEFGEIITVDTTDWTTGGQWTEREQKLFEEKLPVRESSISIVPFPNPFIQSVELVPIGFNTGTSIEYCIVDRHYNVLFRGSNPTLRFMLQAAAIGITDTVRMYYRLRHNDSASCGHGDLVVAPAK